MAVAAAGAWRPIGGHPVLPCSGSHLPLAAVAPPRTEQRLKSSERSLLKDLTTVWWSWATVVESARGRSHRWLLEGLEGPAESVLATKTRRYFSSLFSQLVLAGPGNFSFITNNSMKYLLYFLFHLHGAIPEAFGLMAGLQNSRPSKPYLSNKCTQCPAGQELQSDPASEGRKEGLFSFDNQIEI